MKHQILTFLTLVTLGVILTAAQLVPTSPSVNAETSESMMTLDTLPTSLGCKINIKAENKSTKTITVLNQEVKVQLGFYKQFYGKNLVYRSKSGVLARTHQLDLACNINRRYRFKVKAVHNGKTSVKTIYYPGPNKFTKKVNIDLGNLGRYFVNM